MVDEIGVNLYRIEIPLPQSPLRSINSYVVRDPGRNLIVDTGMNREECLDAMTAGLKELAVDLKKTDFFITHFHVDHLGLVSNLAAQDSIIYFNQPDADRFNRVKFGRVWEDMVGYIRMNGFPKRELREAVLNHPAKLYGSNDRLTFRFLKDGDTLAAGSHLFRCVETPGHTQGHMCLYEPNAKILVSGDHILQDITPTVSLRSDEENPLKEYLKSLDRVSGLEVDLVLPGHRKVFRNCRERIGELKRHHERRLDEILSILKRGEKDAYRVATEMSWDVAYDSWESFPALQKWFAVGEALSHLKYLEAEGKVQKEIRGQKIVYIR